MSETPLRRTPLHARHAAAGAKLVPFAGFEMPVVYTSILEEHRSVRSAAGVFDVSHMGEIRLRGPQARKLAQRLFTNDVAETPFGSVRYGFLCAEDGGVVDDVTLYRVTDHELLFCVNAATANVDLEWIRSVAAHGRYECEIIDESDATALLAVQGPDARKHVHAILPDAPRPGRWKFAAARFEGAETWLSRTGYTGEDGYEIFMPNRCAVPLWDALCARGVRPIGLAARDTLRTEMGYSLYGHELDPSTNPLDAGLERFVAFGRGFIGEEALLEIQKRGPTRRIVGLLLEGRAVARPGAPIVRDGPIGTVTSGTFGPSIERSIAIGYVPAEHAGAGVRLGIEIRGKVIPCEVAQLPFFHRKK
jgi:aminomethyltransferase